jgi:hypothetical protein
MQSTITSGSLKFSASHAVVTSISGRNFGCTLLWVVSIGTCAMASVARMSVLNRIASRS